LCLLLYYYQIYNRGILFFFFLGNSDGMYHMKILIPCITAGAIIGKGGETIAQLQTETNTKVKMSKTNDFYPGKSTISLNMF